MVRKKLTSTQRRILSFKKLGVINPEEVAGSTGMSVGKVNKIIGELADRGLIEGAPTKAEREEEAAKDKDYPPVITFETTGDATVHEVWRDQVFNQDTGAPIRNLWLRSNDGDLVVVPEKLISELPLG